MPADIRVTGGPPIEGGSCGGARLAAPLRLPRTRRCSCPVPRPHGDLAEQNLLGIWQTGPESPCAAGIRRCGVSDSREQSTGFRRESRRCRVSDSRGAAARADSPRAAGAARARAVPRTSASAFESLVEVPRAAASFRIQCKSDYQ